MPSRQRARGSVVVRREVLDEHVGDRRDHEWQQGIGVAGFVFKLDLEGFRFNGAETRPVSGEDQLAEQVAAVHGNIRSGVRVVDDHVGVKIHGDRRGIVMLVDHMRWEITDVGRLHEERLHIDKLDRRKQTATGDIHDDIHVEEAVRGKIAGRTAAFHLAGADRPRRGFHARFHGKAQMRGVLIGHVHGLEEGVDFPSTGGRSRPGGMFYDLTFVDIGTSGHGTRKHAGIFQRRTGDERIAPANARREIVHRRTGERAAFFVEPETFPPGDGDVVERAVRDEGIEYLHPALVEDDLKLPHRGRVIIAGGIGGE